LLTVTCITAVKCILPLLFESPSYFNSLAFSAVLLIRKDWGKMLNMDLIWIHLCDWNCGGWTLCLLSWLCWAGESSYSWNLETEVTHGYRVQRI